jgi:hypothetical protein
MMGSMAGFAQQSSTLFFMHTLPEANFINPAVQGRCGDFVGLPLISSFHMNIANSGFTAGDMVKVVTDGTLGRRTDFNTQPMSRLSFFNSEFHSTLLAVGLQRKELYYTFTITEKNHASLLYTPDMVAFILRGDPQFEGEQIQLHGLHVSMNHYREYAFGISKEYSDNLLLGIKVKLLFGKLNFTTANTNFSMFVDDNSDNIVMGIKGGYKSSMPYSLREVNPGQYRFYNRYDAPLINYLMNGRNPGLAVDLGFIYKYSKQLTFSGSLLDLGMIFYRSNLTQYRLSGSMDYSGPFGDGMVTDAYLWDVFDDMNQNMTSSINADAYLFALDPRLYLGASYAYNRWLFFNLLMYNRYFPRKLQTGFTLSTLARFGEKFEASVSWSYINHSLKNLGLGMGYTFKPFQLYVVSDNIFGFIFPLGTNNANIRLGMNLFLGCRNRFDLDQCGCTWMKNAEEHPMRKGHSRRNRKFGGR